MSGGERVGRHQALLADQLADERAKKTSLEQRGIAVISTSGVLVAVAFGFQALAWQERPAALEPAAIGLLLVAFGCLVSASVAGLTINLPVRLPVVDAAELVQQSMRADWYVSSTDSAQGDYQHGALLLAGLRKVNRVRARTLFAALLLETLALIMMACSLAVTLWPGLSR
jgi:hypothetical protein